MKEENLILSDGEVPFLENALSIYVKDAFRYKALSMEENKELAYLYKNGDNEAKDKMIKGNLRLVLYIAGKYNNKLNGNQILDIIQEGNIGLMKAIENYNPSIGAFSTYATYWIKQGINSFLYNDDIIRKPIKLKEAINNYSKYIEKYKNKDDKVICKDLNINPLILKKIREVLNTSIVSLNVIVDDEKCELNEFISSFKNDYENIENRIIFNNILLIMKKVLSNFEYFVLYNHLLSENKLTLEEMGNMFGITKERIRQVEKKALECIKSILNNTTKKNAILNRIKNKEGKKIDSLKVYPINPNNIVMYLYIKDELSFIEKKILYMIYFEKYNYSKTDICIELGINLEEFDSIYQELIEKINEKLKDKEKYNKYKNNTILNYGTKIFNINFDSELIIDNQKEKSCI